MREIKHKEFENNLKEIYKKEFPKGNRRIKFTSNINLEESDDGKNLVLIIKNPEYNMQSNEAAFEGWMLIIKYYFGKYSKIILKWNKSKFFENSEKQHYQRFLYRVKKFSELFDWFEIDKSIKDSMKSLEIDNHNRYVINVATKDRLKSWEKHNTIEIGDIIKTESENKVEAYMMLNCKDIIIKSIEFQDFKLFSRQLPVGLFKQIKSNETKIFTGSHSAIDLFGVNNESLCIFELKINNIAVGIISELFFYTMFMRDMQDKKFEYFNDKNRMDYYDGLIRTKKIEAFMLVDELHPLIRKEMIFMLNTALKSKYSNIVLGLIRYNIEKDKIIFKKEY